MGISPTTRPEHPTGSDGNASVRARRFDPVVALFAAIVYVPLLLSHAGVVFADTKSYLYLDPGRMLGRAASMWDQHIGLGTTTHQNIGYLFPMGPFFWITERVLHLPPWVAQRLWLGSLLFLAGLGARYLLRMFGVGGAGVVVGMVAYTFTPYALEYSSRLSVLLSPWAALPWLIAFTARALVRRGWRYPALIALTIQLAGGVNASSLVFALLGPCVYVVYGWCVTHETDLRRVVAFAWRTVLLVGATSLWWISGLWVEGRFGLNILNYTETVSDVSRTLFPYELLRGLGYWMFYVRDPIGYVNGAVVAFSRIPGLPISLAVPVVALLAAACLRWRYRLFFVLLVLTGVVVATGAAPFDHPSVAGGLFKAAAAGSTVGLALRSTARATPLIALGLAVLLAAGVDAAYRRLRDRGRIRPARMLAGATCVLLLANANGLWTGSYYSAYLGHRSIPRYWSKALAAADAGDHGTRVLAVPGADFAGYRWGDTIDPIEPGLMDRPYVARELVPWGSPAGANLVAAYDASFQEATVDPKELASVARLMSVGDVLVRLDMDAKRFNLGPASDLWRRVTESVGSGLASPHVYGSARAVRALADSTGPATPTRPARMSVPAVALARVGSPVPIVRTADIAAPIVVAGDGQGLVDLAGAGLLDARRTYLSAPALSRSGLRRLPADAVLVITDSNRRRDERGVVSRYGYTQVAGEQPLVPDPHDQRLEPFPGQTDSSRTVDELQGVRSVRATSYGSQFGYTPANRPAAAIDGNVGTAWTVDASHGHPRLVVTLEHPITTDHIGLAQPGFADGRYVSSVRLRFDGGPPVTAQLSDPRAEPAGQFVRFDRRRFRRLEFEIATVHPGQSVSGPRSAPVVGFSEIAMADEAPGSTAVHAVETMRLPTDVPAALGARTARHPMVVVMSRESTMDRFGMRRRFETPTARAFGLSGSVTLSRRAHDAAVDAALGIPDAAHGGITVTSNSRYGVAELRASDALDGDTRTAWEGSAAAAQDPRLTVALGSPMALGTLHLNLVTDRRHAVPTGLVVTSGTETRTVALALPSRSRAPTTSVDVSFPPLTGTTFDFRFTNLRGGPGGASASTARIGVAELGMPGVRRAPTPDRLPDVCRSGLLQVDGRDIPEVVSGSAHDAEAGLPLVARPCAGADSVSLRAGVHTVTAPDPFGVAPDTEPFAMRRVVLSSGADGAAADPGALLTGTRSLQSGPAVKVTGSASTSVTLRTAASHRPYWLVLGQNVNPGWHASIDGHDLGAPRLVDGFANGWSVPARFAAHASGVTIEWAPQRTVWIALGLSLVAGILCLVVVLVTTRRRRGEVARSLPPPTLSRPTDAGGPYPVRATVLVGLLLGAGAAVFVRPWTGLVVAGVVYLASRWRWARVALRFAPALLLGLAAIGITLAQVIHPVAPSIDAPAAFDAATAPVWLALFLLLADAGLDGIAAPPGPDPVGPGPGAGATAGRP